MPYCSQIMRYLNISSHSFFLRKAGQEQVQFFCGLIINNYYNSNMVKAPGGSFWEQCGVILCFTTVTLFLSYVTLLCRTLLASPRYLLGPFTLSTRRTLLMQSLTLLRTAVYRCCVPVTVTIIILCLKEAYM